MPPFLPGAPLHRLPGILTAGGPPNPGVTQIGTTRVILSSGTAVIDVAGLWGVAIWSGGTAGSPGGAATGGKSGTYAYKAVRLPAQQSISFVIGVGGLNNGQTGGNSTCTLPSGVLTAPGSGTPTGGDVNLSSSPGGYYDGTTNTSGTGGSGGYGGRGGSTNGDAGGGGAPSSIPNLPGGFGGSYSSSPPVPAGFPGGGGAAGSQSGSIYEPGANGAGVLIYLGP